jgi:hypothetical protein
MSQINPIMGSLVGAPAAQRLAESEKSRQIRHSSDLRKNTAANSEEEVEESVASADAVEAAGDGQQNRKQGKGTYSRQKPQEPQEEADNPDGLDLTA